MIAPVITPAWMGTMSGREEKADEERSKRTKMEKWQWKANARLKSGVFIRKKNVQRTKKKNSKGDGKETMLSFVGGNW